MCSASAINDRCLDMQKNKPKPRKRVKEDKKEFHDKDENGKSRREGASRSRFAKVWSNSRVCLHLPFSCSFLSLSVSPRPVSPAPTHSRATHSLPFLIFISQLFIQFFFSHISLTHSRALPNIHIRNWTKKAAVWQKRREKKKKVREQENWKESRRRRNIVLHPNVLFCLQHPSTYIGV